MAKKRRVQKKFEHNTEQLQLRELRLYLKWLLGLECAICGYDRTSKALEFHHIDPDEKKITVSRATKTQNYDIILREVRKCVLLCANCHREVEEGLVELCECTIRDQHRLLKARLREKNPTIN